VNLRRVACAGLVVVLAAVAALGVFLVCECDTTGDPLRLLDGSIEGSWIPRPHDDQEPPTAHLAFVADRSGAGKRPRYEVRWDGGTANGCAIDDHFHLIGPGIDWPLWLDTRKCPCSERDPDGDRLFVDGVPYVRGGNEQP
jgi:hypothetical protein